MKKLFLLRHAKSDWTDISLTDFDRPLNERGALSADQIGTYIKGQNIQPARILASSSKRTRETANRVLDEAGLDCPVDYLDQIYLAGTSTLLDLIRDVDDRDDPLMIVGHNPGMHALAVALTATGHKIDLDRLHEKYPTATLVEISLDIDHWQDIKPEQGHLVRYVKPRQLGEL